MAEIKPDEISAILRQQLTNFNATADLEEVGTVLQVGDGIARVYGLNNVRAGELVEFDNGVRAIAFVEVDGSRISRSQSSRHRSAIEIVFMWTVCMPKPVSVSGASGSTVPGVSWSPDAAAAITAENRRSMSAEHR